MGSAAGRPGGFSLLFLVGLSPMSGVGWLLADRSQHILQGFWLGLKEEPGVTVLGEHTGDLGPPPEPGPGPRMSAY